MPRIGEPGANPLGRVCSELGYLASCIVIRYIEREYVWPVPRLSLLPVLAQFGTKILADTCLFYASVFFVLDAIDSPYARSFP
jgi:hypothetical protein